jgi:hypothetical protein
MLTTSYWSDFSEHEVEAELIPDRRSWRVAEPTRRQVVFRSTRDAPKRRIGMQDWFTDSHEAFARTVETMIGLYGGDFEACATCEEQPWFSFFLTGREIISSLISRS